MPDVSIVVLFTREAALAERCLSAVVAGVDSDLDAELVLVLNDVPAATREMVRALTPAARLIESSLNTGTNAGWNLAFAAARGPHVALLHEDSVPRPGWVSALLRTARAYPRAAVIGSRLLLPDGRLWSAGTAIWEDGSTTILGPERWPASETVTAPYHVDSVASASMLVDRAAWTEIGGFDERFFPALYTEPDFSIATWLRGRTVMADPAAVVVHDTGAMERADRGSLGSPRFRQFLVRRARGRLVDKWGAELSRFGPLRPGQRGFTTTPADVEQALARTVRRAAAPAAARKTPPAVQARALTAPEGGWPTTVDPAIALRFDVAQRAVEREFSDWLLDQLNQAVAERDRARARKKPTRESSEVWTAHPERSMSNRTTRRRKLRRTVKRLRHRLRQLRRTVKRLRYRLRLRTRFGFRG